MPVLDNPRHERFAQLLAEGKSAAEAYVLAGFKANDGNAIRLKGNERVRSRVDELLSRAAIRTEITIEKLTDMLIEDRTLARELGQSGPAVSATEKLGKLHGFFVDRSENVNLNYDVTDEPITEDEWAEQHASTH